MEKKNKTCSFATFIKTGNKMRKPLELKDLDISNDLDFLDDILENFELDLEPDAREMALSLTYSGCWPGNRPRIS